MSGIKQGLYRLAQRQALQVHGKVNRSATTHAGALVVPLNARKDQFAGGLTISHKDGFCGCVLARLESMIRRRKEAQTVKRDIKPHRPCFFKIFRT